MPARLRAPTHDDADAVLEIVLARDVADLGVPDFTLEDLRADWGRPDVDLEHDARVARDDHGTLRGYAILLGDDAVVTVDPRAEGQGLGTVLRRWAEVRAAERGTATLRQFVAGRNDSARRLLTDAGYAPVQSYFRLRADLAAVPQATAARPRPFRTPDDDTALHALVEEAFAEVEGHQPMPLEVWRAKRVGKSGWDPGLWLLLEDGEGLAGAALGERWEDGTGYVAELAVARRARGRGHGRALLLGLFDAFRETGLRHAQLSVHGRNRAALRLYESVGMRPTWEAERWEKPL